MGPEGFAVISQIYNFFLLFTSIIVLGIPLGFTSLFPKLLSESNGLKLVYTYIKAFSTRVVILTCALMIIFIIFSPQLSLLLVENSDFFLILIIILLAAPFTVTYSLVEPYLKAKGEINTIVKVSIISNIVPFLILIPLIIYFGISGVSYYLLLYGCFPIIIFLFFFNRNFFKKIKSSNETLELEKKKSILKVGIVSLISSFLFQFSIIYIRKFSINSFGIENTGIYQSLLSLSTNYFTFIYVFLANYSLPKLAVVTSNSEISDEINNNFRLLLFILIPIVIIVFTYREFIIQLVFSNSFASASNYIFFQLVGDIFRAFGALFGLWLVPMEKLKVLIAVDFIMNFLLISLPYIFFNFFHLNIVSLPVTYLISFFIHFLLLFLFTRRSLHFKFTPRNLNNIVISFAVFIISFIAASYFVFYGYFLIPVLLIIWTWFFLETEERKSLMNKALSILQSKS